MFITIAAATLLSSGKTAALTGTATGAIVEANIVSGGKQIILTLSGETWVPT